MSEKNPIQVSDRIFRTIELLAKSGPSGLLEISNELELNKSTVHRILNSLICMDYVKQDADTSKYSLTFKICRLSNQILSQNNLIDIARPYIQDLADQTGETVHLVQMEGINAVYIDKVEAPHNSVRMVSMVGKTIPLYCSGVGKAILADMEDDKILQIWEQSDLQSYTANTVTDYAAFQEVISTIRKNGYAMDNEEMEIGVRCIAVSLGSVHHKFPYAISISAPKDRMRDKQITQYKKLLLNTKKQLLEELGQ